MSQAVAFSQAVRGKVSTRASEGAADADAPLALSVEDDALTRLMERYCAGERAAFEALYRQVAERLLRYIAGLMGNRTVAEDILQQTFLKVHAARPSYVAGARPLPWFYAIAHRTCIDELRRRKSSRLADVPASFDSGRAGEEPWVRAAGLVAELDGVAEGTRDTAKYDPELAQAAMGALADLPVSQREALLLTKVHGHSCAQAAAILGTTAGAVKVRSHRGYVALRKMLRLEKP